MDRRRAFKIVWFKMKDPNTSIMKKNMIGKSRTEKKAGAEGLQH